MQAYHSVWLQRLWGKFLDVRLCSSPSAISPCQRDFPCCPARRLCRYALQGACKFGVFESFAAKTKSTMSTDIWEARKHGVFLKAAAVAELVATTALSPWEAVRIKMVADPTFARHLPAAVLRVWREEGALGFYRGWAPLLCKQLPYTIVQLTVFSSLVGGVYETWLPSMGIHKSTMSTSSQLAVSAACGVVAGVTSSIASQPGDTVLTRINSQLKTAAAQAKGQALPRASIVGVVKELGWSGLWLGTGTRAVMTALLSAGMFLVYDVARVSSHAVCGS